MAWLEGAWLWGCAEREEGAVQCCGQQHMSRGQCEKPGEGEGGVGQGGRWELEQGQCEVSQREGRGEGGREEDVGTVREGSRGECEVSRGGRGRGGSWGEGREAVSIQTLGNLCTATHAPHALTLAARLQPSRFLLVAERRAARSGRWRQRGRRSTSGDRCARIHELTHTHTPGVLPATGAHAYMTSHTRTHQEYFRRQVRTHT